MSTDMILTKVKGNTRATRRTAAWIAVVVAMATLGLRAHDTWLQPDRFAATPGAVVTLDLTSSDGFVGFQTAIQPERVARALGKLAGGELAPSVPSATEKTLRFSATVTRPGIAVLGVELRPRLLELAADKIEVYFREIHAGDELREAWAVVPEPKRWRESYVKHAKTFVRVGEPAADDRGWAEPLGLGLEIIPERDPTKLQAGEALPVRVLRGGKPLAGFALGYVSEGETREHVAMTDAEGRASATLDVKGVWLVHGTDLRRVVAADREWESDFTTMVVEVR
jgi:uncharacterized GH25 family protein